jgi:hypothetical protein
MSASGPLRRPAVLSVSRSGRPTALSSRCASECSRCLSLSSYGVGALGLLAYLSLLLRVLTSPAGGWGSRGLKPLLGCLLLAWSPQLPLPCRTARHVVVLRRGRLWSLRSSQCLLCRVRGATCTPRWQSLLLSQPHRLFESLHRLGLPRQRVAMVLRFGS